MYLPKHFSDNNNYHTRELIIQNGFATVLSFPENQHPFINHLPLVFSSQPGQEEILIGHMAKRNPQWQHFQKNPNCTAIINGPHTYITPTWYNDCKDVPTWNYAVAHLYGKIELIQSINEQIEILKQMTAHYEKHNLNPWQFEIPDDLKDEAILTSAIISFKFRIEKIDAKFKLSQNQSITDRKSIIDGLSQRKDNFSHAVRDLMLRNEKF